MSIKALPGFVVLFGIYQLAESAIYYQNNIPLFLGLMALVPCVAYSLSRLQGRNGLQDTGLAPGRGAASRLWVGLGIGLVIYFLSFALSLAMGLEQVIAVPPTADLIRQAAIFAVGVFLPSLAEDVVTRAYVYAHWPSKYSSTAFVVFSSVVYVLNHIHKLADGPAILIYLFVTGISLAIPLVVTRSLWYTLGLHWACNIVYRITADVLPTKTISQGAFTSLTLLTLVVALSIPLNWYIAVKLKPPAP